MAGSAWTNQLINLIVLAAQQAGFSGFFVYSPAPGTGNLIVSITGAAGTDPNNNPYPGPGVAVGKSSATQLFLTSQGGVGQLLFLLNNALFGNGVLESAVIGGFGQIVLNGPKLLSLPDFVGIELNSNNGSGTANLAFIYNDSGGSAHVSASYSDAGFNIPAGSITAVEPGTGTSPSNAASPESWHAASLPGGWGGGISYKLYPDDTVALAGTVTLPSSGSYNNVTLFTLPSGYIPPGTKNIAMAAFAQSAAYGNNSSSPGLPRVVITSGGAVSFAGIPASVNSSQVCVDGVRFPLDF